MCNDARRLVVNADDFGLSPGVNRGIVTAFEQGILTSTSLMVRWPAAKEAARYARTQPSLGVGLHIDLGEWTHRNGEWRVLYEVIRPGDAADAEGEINRQLDTFQSLMGGNPTHLDSHQHVHRDEPVRQVACRLAVRLGVPLREITPGIAYDGSFYGQNEEGFPYPEGVTADRLIAMIRSLPPGVTEFGCHPGFDDGLDTMYRSEREQEVEALCDPAVRAAIDEEGIELITFADLR